MKEALVTVVTGDQRGDEAKGKITDLLAPEVTNVVRGQGGNNAGHTVKTDTGIELALSSIPSGIANPGIMNTIGRGCLVHAGSLHDEIERVKAKDVEVSPDNLMLSSGAQLILPHHISMDEIREQGPLAQGSTKKGISEAASSKYGRRTEEALRAEVIKNSPDLLFTTIRNNLEMSSDLRAELGLEPMDPEQQATDYVEKALKLAEYITDAEVRLHKEFLQQGKPILAEGAQAFLLDIDHGMWPFVTSSSTTAGGILNGAGIPGHKYPTNVIGVSKAIQSHVGGGPFVTEITDPGLLEQLHGDLTTIDAETGTVTGRKRRLGHLDLTGVKRAHWFNGTTYMALSKLDWVPRFGDEAQICVSYKRMKPDGTVSELDVASDAAYKLEECVPEYVTVPTWTEDIQDVRRYEELPKRAQEYIEFIEKIVEIPVLFIGVGPGREQIIDRRKELGLAS